MLHEAIVTSERRIFQAFVYESGGIRQNVAPFIFRQPPQSRDLREEQDIQDEMNGE
jgi:hypothetical protein